jgi:hypothetical protein
LLAGRGIAALRQSLRELDESLQAAVPVQAPEITALQPASALRRVYERRSDELLRAEGGQLPTPQILKIAALQALEATPFVVPRPALEAPVRQLLQARTVAEVRKGREALVNAAAHAHTMSFAQGLVIACRQAASDTGFSTISVVEGSNDRPARVVATDSQGRGLVSEVHTDVHGDAALHTEVIGVTDGTCQDILNAFDRALEARGVRAAEVMRLTTGGACVLDASREIAGCSGSTPLRAGAIDTRRELKRRQQLNASTRQKGGRRG